MRLTPPPPLPPEGIEAIAALAGLAIPAPCRPGVARFLALAAEMAAVLEGVETGEDFALAPVFSLPGADGDG